MTDQRVPFGSMVRALQDFNDYRLPSKKANYSYKKGDIVPVDSILVYTISSLVKNNLFEVIENQQWEGFENDYSLDKNEYIQYPIFKIRFKNPNSFLVLPNLNNEYTYKVQENIIINDGVHSFKIKYYDGQEFPDFEVLPGKAYKAIYMDDESVKGRWIFSSFNYVQDSVLEVSSGSPQIDQQKYEGTFRVYEDLDQFDFVHIFLNEDSNLTIKKAYAQDNYMKAHAMGFVKSSYLEGSYAEVYISGIIEFSSSSLVSGKSYFLSASEKGKISDVVVSSPGQLLQKLGEAWTGSKFNVSIDQALTLF